MVRFLTGFLSACVMIILSIHAQERLGKSTGLELSETARDLIEAVNLADSLAERDLDEGSTRERLLTGLLKGLDPHSGYLPAAGARDILGPEEGVETRKENSFGFVPGRWRGEFVVEIVFPGGPADISGLRAGDRVTGIRGRNLENASYEEIYGAFTREIAEGNGRVFHIEVVNLLDEGPGMRRMIALRPYPHDVPRAFDLGMRDGVLIVAIPAMMEGVSGDIRNIIENRIATEPVLNGVVFDLRGDPGGLAGEAVKIAELFVPKNALIYEMAGRGVGTVSFRTRKKPVFDGLNVSVVVNKGTASAAEILAEALRVHSGAKLIGWKTYGKNTVQRVVGLTGGGAIKLTIARYRTASGGMPEDGLTPDVSISGEGSAYRPFRFEVDPALQAAVRAVSDRN